jgi:acyl-coenzyme A thioesterase PaaI-like protein
MPAALADGASAVHLDGEVLVEASLVQDALGAHPLFQTLGLTVPCADRGRVVVRLPNSEQVGAVGYGPATGAVYAAAELAASIALATEVDGARLRSGRIRWQRAPTGPLTAEARLADGAVDKARADESSVAVVVKVLDAPGAQIAEARFRFALAP